MSVCVWGGGGVLVASKPMVHGILVVSLVSWRLYNLGKLLKIQGILGLI